MKNIIKVLALAIAMVTISTSAYAQKNERQRITREVLAETQARFIAKEMAMDDSTATRFVETFCQFQKEIWALGPRPRKESSSCSDAETKQIIADRFAHSQKILDLRKKYYAEYCKFLTQKQIERVYKLERRMMNHLYHRSQKEKPQ